MRNFQEFVGVKEYVFAVYCPNNRIFIPLTFFLVLSSDHPFLNSKMVQLHDGKFTSGNRH